ncbi:MAG: tyrosine-protein phosphatase [Rhodoferax sp.]|nr:tyrosine-protein phosphatase [Pseudorhodobacter sp.]
MAGSIKRWALRVAGVACVLLLVLLGFLGIQQYTGNFHAVVDGEVYRSAQMTGTQLSDYTAKVGLKSVLNLRGAAPDADWYQAEIADSARLGLVHADFALSASREVTNDEAVQLIVLMRTLPKPLLIHCKQGSDRTGLLAALYLASIKGVDVDTADDELSLAFGHFSVPYLSTAYPMDISWNRLEVVLNLPQ